ncbi:MAG TPA: DUF6544 family protein [Polyangiaceae bacterium]|nr:DUF6544 family protein [Polyangiaceae bacterium]
MQAKSLAAIWMQRRSTTSLTRRRARTNRRFVREVAALDLPRGPGSDALVTDEDLARLPRPVQRYLRFMKVVGRPRDWSFRAGFEGRFRRGPSEAWLPCEVWQYDSAIEVARIFHMRLALANLLPTVVRDTYLKGHGRMQARAFDLFNVVNATGLELDLGEMVTYLNDAIFLAPSMILRPHTEWLPVGENCFDVKLFDGGNVVTARVLIDECGAPYEFSTTDRFVSDPYTKGHPLVGARWTTPFDDWVTLGARVVPRRGKAIWHLPGGTFEYAHFYLQHRELAFNVAPGE